MDNERIINNDEYNALVKEAEKLRKHRESVNKSVKKYNANHKADPSFLEYNRIKEKKFYERHKEELKEKKLKEEEMKEEIEELKKEIFEETMLRIQSYR